MPCVLELMHKGSVDIWEEENTHIRPSKILRIVGDIVYELALSLIFSDIHLVLHVSMLW